MILAASKEKMLKSLSLRGRLISASETVVFLQDVPSLEGDALPDNAELLSYASQYTYHCR
jgi:hypothetical protein